MGAPDQSSDPRRVQAWCALAELLLDTDTDERLSGVAARCHELGYGPEDVRQMWRHEVTPALIDNLRVVAGQWDGWDPDFVIERVRRARGRAWNGPHLLGRFLFRLRALWGVGKTERDLLRALDERA